MQSLIIKNSLLSNAPNEIELNKDDFLTHNNEGISLVNLKKYKESIQCFDKAIAINSNYFNAYQNKGNALISIKKFEEAIKCYNKIFEMKPNDEIKCEA